jgi:spermidine dehydrogenase
MTLAGTRNEFNVDGRLVIGYGGSESIQSPRSLWSPVALGLLHKLGVDPQRFDTAFDRTLYPGPGLSRGLFFARESFGTDTLVRGDPLRMVADDIPPDRMNARAAAAFIADYLLSDEQKRPLQALFTEKRDVLAGKTSEEKRKVLAKISYRDYLKQYWSIDDKAADPFQGRSNDFFAIGIDGVPASDAMDAGYPGFQGLGLAASAQAQAEVDEPYIYHFPDGNAAIARLLVRHLIPGAAPGSSMEDIVSARFDYGRLDRRGAPVRLRLMSTATTLLNHQGMVDVGYVRAGVLHRVRASQAVYAGYGMVLPYFCPDIGESQKTALSAGLKAPLAYVNVAVRNWEPWVRQGVHEITNPMGLFSRVKLDYPVSLGDYRFPSRPQDPMLLHLVHVPTLRMTPGLDMRTAWRAARAQLYALTFDEFELHIRDELGRMLGGAGFDPAKDIRAITVNRWGHGYSYMPNSLFDEPREPAVNVIARQRNGRIAIAGTDAAWNAYAHAAIDEARRAVADLAV